MNIPSIIEEHHQAMIDKGFYDCPKCDGKGWFDWREKGEPRVNVSELECPLCNGSKIDPNKNIGELLMLIITELSEALESHRTKCFANCDIDDYEIMLTGEHYKQWFEKHVKDSFEDEIADVFLRLFDLCGYLEIEPSPAIPDSFKYDTENVGEILLYITRNIFDIKLTGDRPFSISGSLYYLWCSAVNSWNIPIEKYILAKMAYNKTRPHKHGKEY